MERWASEARLTDRAIIVLQTPKDTHMPGTITTTLLNFRATPDQRGTIQRAAQLSAQTMSDLSRNATLEAAARILEGKR